MNKATINSIFKAVGLAMGVVTVVLSALNQLEVSNGLLFLGIGLTSLAIAQLNQQ